MLRLYGMTKPMSHFAHFQKVTDIPDNLYSEYEWNIHQEKQED